MSDWSVVGIYLQHAGEEALREEEAREPIAGHLGVLHPPPEKVDARVKVHDPAGEWLQAGVPHAGPHHRHLVVEQALVHFLQLPAHYHQPLDRLLQLQQRATDPLLQLDEAHLTNVHQH
eukprot:3949061-Pyramimonas_sp.AAC.2